MIDKVQSYYGFTTMPFGKQLAPSQLHRHTSHAQAVARIGFTITSRGIALICGEAGAGKTVAARAAITDLDQARHRIIYLPNPTTGARGICHQLVVALGGVPRFQNAALYPQAAEALVAENTERGRQPILVIDEAHLLDHQQLELVRMLTNTNMDSNSPLAVILVGQPTLRRNLKLGVLAALDQRITTRYTLEGMTRDETASYLTHHLTIAGRTDTLYSDDAIALIHKTSRGYPRTINNLAIQALVAAFADQKAIVDESSATAAVNELTSQ